VFLPNAPPGGDRRPQDPPSASFLRERFGLAKDKFPWIVLQAGMISESTFSLDLAKSFRKIERRCALVLHDRIKRKERDRYIQKLRHANQTNLFLSLDPVPIEELDEVYASADVGLAFYRELDANFSQISLASGKLAYYLKHGKPVIVSDSASLKTFVESREIGIVVHDPTDPVELESALDTVQREYARFAANARKCFEAELDFDRNVETVLELLRGRKQFVSARSA
jgi:glycosyltransferase involved in cell wall biosynthesis